MYIYIYIHIYLSIFFDYNSTYILFVNSRVYLVTCKSLNLFNVT